MYRARKRRRGKAWIYFLFPSFAGVFLFVLLPFLDVVRRSFLTAVGERFNGIENYKTIFHNEAFLLAVRNTVLFTGFSIPLLVVLGLLIALPLGNLRNVQMLKSLYLFPLAMPTATIVLVWKMLFYEKGLLNKGLTEIMQGLTGKGDVISVDYLGTGAAFFLLAGTYIWKNIGYTIVLWLAGIMGVSQDILEAAKVDGVGKWRNFFYILLPNLKGSLYTIVVLSFLNSFKIYREAYLVAGAYPHESIYLLQHLFNNWYVNLELDKMAAAAVLTGSFLFVMILLLQKLWDKED